MLLRSLAMKRFVMISTTTDSSEKAREIARYLVESSLAACVQIIGPIDSIYRWKGGVEEAWEWLCLVKTRSGLFDQVRETIQQQHSYETPEIVAWPLEKGSREYFTWLNDSMPLLE
jgi:periplasmic divalent cation tolerance protein